LVPLEVPHHCVYGIHHLHVRDSEGWAEQEHSTLQGARKGSADGAIAQPKAQSSTTGSTSQKRPGRGPKGQTDLCLKNGPFNAGRLSEKSRCHPITVSDWQTLADRAKCPLPCQGEVVTVAQVPANNWWATRLGVDGDPQHRPSVGCSTPIEHARIPCNNHCCMKCGILLQCANAQHRQCTCGATGSDVRCQASLCSTMARSMLLMP